MRARIFSVGSGNRKDFLIQITGDKRNYASACMLKAILQQQIVVGK